MNDFNYIKNNCIKSWRDNSGYADVENSALYPFGHGLSYTKFSYTDVILDKTELTLKSKITLSFKSNFLTRSISHFL